MLFLVIFHDWFVHSLIYKELAYLFIAVFAIQNVPTASVAADIVYRHVPSATCVTEVFI